MPHRQRDFGGDAPPHLQQKDHERGTMVVFMFLLMNKVLYSYLGYSWLVLMKKFSLIKCLRFDL